METTTRQRERGGEELFRIRILKTPVVMRERGKRAEGRVKGGGEEWWRHLPASEQAVSMARPLDKIMKEEHSSMMTLHRVVNVIDSRWKATNDLPTPPEIGSS